MTDSVQSPTSYLDFTGLAQLRGKARADSASAAKETGQQFEAMFLQMMMKSMRAATPKSDFLQSTSMDTYEELYDKEISMQMAKRGALGIGDMFSRQSAPEQPAALDAANLSKPAGMTQGTSAAATGTGMPLTVKQPELPIQKPARIFVIARPQEGGLTLNRPAPVPASEPSPAVESAPTKE